MSATAEFSDGFMDVLAQKLAEYVEQVPARQWFNCEQAADYLGTTKEAIKGYVKRGQLIPSRRKPFYLFSRDELDRYGRGDG
jgi:hypothetical protein